MPHRGTHGPLDEQERRRWKERERADLEVERIHAERPLEGLSGETAGTTWTEQQDDVLAREVHAHDEERSTRASEEQARRLPDRPE